MNPRNLWHTLIVAAAVRVVAGCGVMTIDVDVYKGPLIDNEDVRTERLAQSALDAKTTILSIRNSAERAAIKRENESKQEQVKPSPQKRLATADDLNEQVFLEPKTIQFRSQIAQRLNEALILYRDSSENPTAFNVKSSSAAPLLLRSSAASIEEVKNSTDKYIPALSDQIENFLAARSQAAYTPATDPTRPDKEQALAVQRDYVLRILVELGQTLISATQSEFSSVESGAVLTADERIALEVQGNTLIVGVHEMREQERFALRSTRGYEREKTGLLSASESGGVRVLGRARVRIDAEMQEARRQAGIATSAVTAEQRSKDLNDELIAPKNAQDTADHDLTDITNEAKDLKNAAAVAQKEIAEIKSNDPPVTLAALQTAVAAALDSQGAAANAKDAADLIRGMTVPNANQPSSVSLAEARKPLSDALTAAVTKTQDVLVQKQGVATNRRTIAAQQVSTINSQLAATKNLQSLERVSEWVQKASNLPVDSSDKTLGLQPATAFLDSALKEELAKTPPDQDILAAIKIAREKLASSDQVSVRILTNTETTNTDVLDALIANYRYEYLQEVKTRGLDSAYAKNIKDALTEAYRQRADSLYIRSTTTYLKSSYASETLQRGTDNEWRNMLIEQEFRQLPAGDLVYDWVTGRRGGDASSEAAERRRKLDRQVWQNVNRIRVAGGGNVNYVVVKDDVGNWYVKNFSTDVDDVVKAATSLAMFGAGGGNGSELLAAAIDQQAAANVVTGGTKVEKATEQLKALKQAETSGQTEAGAATQNAPSTPSGATATQHDGSGSAALTRQFTAITGQRDHDVDALTKSVMADLKTIDTVAGNAAVSALGTSANADPAQAAAVAEAKKNFDLARAAAAKTVSDVITQVDSANTAASGTSAKFDTVIGMLRAAATYRQAMTVAFHGWVLSDTTLAAKEKAALDALNTSVNDTIIRSHVKAANDDLLRYREALELVETGLVN